MSTFAERMVRLYNRREEEFRAYSHDLALGYIDKKGNPLSDKCHSMFKKKEEAPPKHKRTQEEIISTLFEKNEENDISLYRVRCPVWEKMTDEVIHIGPFTIHTEMYLMSPPYQWIMDTRTGVSHCLCASLIYHVLKTENLPTDKYDEYASLPVFYPYT